MNYYQEENYKIKKPRDLSLSEIKPQDISNIEMCIKRIKRKNITAFIIIPFILAIISLGFYDSIQKSEN